MTTYNEIIDSINCLEILIKENLKELDGDIVSDFAKHHLNINEHYKTAIEIMKNIIDPTHGYAE